MTKRFMILFATVLFALGFSLDANAQWLDGKFNPRAYYSVTFLNNKNEVISHIDAGAYTDGVGTLSLSSDKLEGLAGQTLDILILDKYNGVSSTLSRVTIASAR